MHVNILRSMSPEILTVFHGKGVLIHIGNTYISVLIHIGNAEANTM